MSEIYKAKQRLMMRGASIQEAPEEDFAELRVFSKTGNASSIPKLKIKSREERSISEVEINDNDDEFRETVKNLSPSFSRTDRHNVVYRSDRLEIMSAQGDKNSLQPHPGRKSRRVSQYSQAAIEKQDVSFTENEKSVYNESPIKVSSNHVHNEKMELVISRLPTRRAISPFKPRECELEPLNLLLTEQKSKSSPFTDYMFPPRFSIIFNKKHMYLEEGLKLERLTRIYESQQKKLIKFCEPTLMVPGKYTSPALFSALTILAEEPTWVFNILGGQESNKNGIYYVHYCKDGVWRYVVVDDYMPVKILAKRSLLFLHSLPKSGVVQFWPGIVEKALAKVYGTYQDIYLTADRGVRDIIRSLTGYPVSEYPINKDFRTYLILIDTALKRRQIVVLEMISEEYKETAHLKGIEIDRAYAIIEVKKTYIVLRNINDPELVTKLTFEQALIFHRLLIFRAESNYAYISRTLRHKRGSFSKLVVRVEKTVKCYWDVWQNNEVYYKNHIGSKIEYSRSPYLIQIHKQISPEQTFDSVTADQVLRESGKEITLGAGSYEVVVHLCQPQEQDFTVSYYGEAEVQIERVKNMSEWHGECSC